MTLCSSKSPQRHIILMLYASMYKAPFVSMQAEQTSWETRLGRTVGMKDWEKIYWFIFKGSLSVNIQESGYKIRTRWYRTPDVVHKFSPSVPDRCWRCGKALGTFLHIWWECPLIQPYWQTVHDVTTTVSTLPLEFSSAQYLLHLSKIAKQRYRNSVAIHMINAARLCVPVHWRATEPPTVKEWMARIDRIAAMEELISTAHDRISSFTSVWNE